MTHDFDAYPFEREHCLSISDFHRIDIERLLELGAHYLNLDEQKGGNRKVLHGKTLINLFFENSTRTEKSFELAGKRLGADVISIAECHEPRLAGRAPWQLRRAGPARAESLLLRH